MDTNKKNQGKAKSANVNNERDLEIQNLLDSLNASKAIENVAKSRNFSTDRIWKKTFRDVQRNGKISTSHRNKMAEHFGRIANFVKSGKFDVAKKAYQELEKWASDKLQVQTFENFSDYSNKKISENPEILQFGSDSYDRNADAINSGINAIKIMRIKELI